MTAWRSFTEPRIEKKTILSPKTSIIGPLFKEQAGLVIEAIKGLPIDSKWPKQIKLPNGNNVEITNEMTEIKHIETSISGEWFTPHVIEPAFGIDRIIWHLIDHSYKEMRKEGDQYTIMKFNDNVCCFASSPGTHIRSEKDLRFTPLTKPSLLFFNNAPT